MQTPNSLLCSPNALSPLSPPAPPPPPHRFFSLRPNRAAHIRSRLHRAASSPFRVRLLSRRLVVQPPRVASPLQSAAVQEAIEDGTTESGLIEIGYISSVHGLQGEVCIKSSTDFPELRFSRTGKRWLKQQVLGRETIQEVELVEGRGHPGQKSWILKFEGINSVEQEEILLDSGLSDATMRISGFEPEIAQSKAKKLVGAALLVREEDRPELEEGEFYTRDLVGMRVLLKESGEPIGTVVNIYNSGASDLLHVKLDGSTCNSDGIGMSKPMEAGASNHFVWVPFVEAIVPHVDMDRGEMIITPPKGLLELNLRSHEKSKKERRQLEWKERKQFQKRLIAAKKKLCELEQQHVFHGFRYGDKTQTSLLADQIVGINSKLLQQALQTIDLFSQRWSDATRSDIYDALTTSENYLTPLARMDKQCVNSVFEEKGLHLILKDKVATVLIVTDSAKEASDPAMLSESLIQTLECTNQKLVKVEDRASMPLLMICPAGEIPSFQMLFSENNHFGFDSAKVWFFEEQMLPVVSCPDEEQKRRKILMKSPWEMLQSPIGSGGIMSVILSESIADNLGEIGVEYIQICSTNRRFLDTRTLLLGYVHSREADVGIQVLEDKLFSDESLDLILSMSFLKKLMNETNKLQFDATLRPNSHVELVDKEWVDVVPSYPNSHEIRSSLLFSCLNGCSLDKVCLLEIPE